MSSSTTFLPLGSQRLLSTSAGAGSAPPALAAVAESFLFLLAQADSPRAAERRIAGVRAMGGRVRARVWRRKRQGPASLDPDDHQEGALLVHDIELGAECRDGLGHRDGRAGRDHPCAVGVGFAEDLSLQRGVAHGDVTVRAERPSQELASIRLARIDADARPVDPGALRGGGVRGVDATVGPHAERTVAVDAVAAPGHARPLLPAGSAGVVDIEARAVVVAVAAAEKVGRAAQVLR